MIVFGYFLRHNLPKRESFGHCTYYPWGRKALLGLGVVCYMKPTAVINIYT